MGRGPMRLCEPAKDARVPKIETLQSYSQTPGILGVLDGRITGSKTANSSGTCTLICRNTWSAYFRALDDVSAYKRKFADSPQGQIVASGAYGDVITSSETGVRPEK
jgi:hypothetical protein